MNYGRDLSAVCDWLCFCSYMVDAADQDKLEASKNEFHNLLDKPQLNGIPVLVLANKRDLPGALDEREVIDRMYVITYRSSLLCKM